ncbi:uncharacterized protein LOC111083523 [Limulus polyphemus]|uniref:Uncharacterized protein LOC111083523 n=1 Tax=Limulus polyphemus TaxID=6850 RepID=A0ABM1RWQ8_LIMPO|nr:uncharacterized protein LOC111083523 [Limulus polyphemus]
MNETTSLTHQRSTDSTGSARTQSEGQAETVDTRTAKSHPKDEDVEMTLETEFSTKGTEHRTSDSVSHQDPVNDHIADKKYPRQPLTAQESTQKYQGCVSENQGSVELLEFSLSRDDVTLSDTDTVGKNLSHSAATLASQDNNENNASPALLSNTFNEPEDPLSIAPSEILNSPELTEVNVNQLLESQDYTPELGNDCNTTQVLHPEYPNYASHPEISSLEPVQETHAASLAGSLTPRSSVERRPSPTDTLLRRAKIQRLDTDSL